MPGLKRCTKCQEHKLPDAFSKRSSRCRPCSTRRSAEWRIANPERYRQQMRDWRSRSGSAEKREGYRLKYRYQLTLEQRDTMLETQGNGCAICRAPFEKAPHVDHSHQTGVVRGLLCDLCNRGLGYFKDNPDRLENAAKYLRESA